MLVYTHEMGKSDNAAVVLVDRAGLSPLPSGFDSRQPLLMAGAGFRRGTESRLLGEALGPTNPRRKRGRGHGLTSAQSNLWMAQWTGVGRQREECAPRQ